MKKIMMIAALMVMTIAAKAQNAVGQLTLKPMIGMTIANITDGDGDAKIGLGAGAEFEYGVTDNLGLTFGAVYSMQGSKASGSEYIEDYGSVNASVKLNMEYINIPIMANFYVAPGFAIKAGIQPGFKVSSKYKAEVLGVNVEDDIDGIKSVDFSIPFGLSYEVSNFVIDARYQWGLTKIIDDSDSKNSVFMISLGYKFEL